MLCYAPAATFNLSLEESENKVHASSDIMASDCSELQAEIWAKGRWLTPRASKQARNTMTGPKTPTGSESPLGCASVQLPCSPPLPAVDESSLQRNRQRSAVSSHLILTWNLAYIAKNSLLIWSMYLLQLCDSAVGSSKQVVFLWWGTFSNITFGSLRCFCYFCVLVLQNFTHVWLLCYVHLSLFDHSSVGLNSWNQLEGRKTVN